MKNKKVLVTIAVGQKHYNLWKKFAEPSWKKYAEKYGYDIICFDMPLDDSDRAKSRSVAWQKCLILKDQRVKKYERAVWLDSDIIINDKNAPCIVSDVDKEKIGSVNAWEMTGVSDFPALHLKMIAYCTKFKLPVYRIGKEYFEDYGMPPISDKAVQSGVLVLNPLLHVKVLQNIYDNYEDNRPAYWHYEMRPLSYEIINNNLYQWMDNRFNYVVENLKLVDFYDKYPKNFAGRILRVLKIKTFRYLKLIGISVWEEKLVQNAFENGFFIHFAGNAKEMVFAETLNK